MKQTIMIVMIAVVVILGYSLYGQAADKKDAKALFEDTCGQCHSIDIPKNERLSKDDWQYIVGRMKDNGCSLSDREAAAIIEYLAATYGKK